MKISISIGLALFASTLVFLLNSCLGDSNPVEDTRKTAAIRKVELSVDTGTVEPSPGFAVENRRAERCRGDAPSEVEG